MDEDLKKELAEILTDDRVQDAENIWETLSTAQLLAEDIFIDPSEAVVFKIYQFLRIEDGVRELKKNFGEDIAKKV